MNRLAVFDCDGTLVDGQAAICDTMADAFAKADLPLPDRNQVRRIVGLSLPQALRLLAPGYEAKHGALLEHYKTGFRDRRTSGVLEEPLYDGIVALIERLSQAGWQLGVATGKSDRGLFSCLERHGLLDRFVTLQTADRHPSKPHPAMLEQAMTDAGADTGSTVMIGDTTFDMEMAAAAGVRAFGVAWGYHEPAELLEAGAEAVANDMAELEQMISNAV
ncbi:HAD family hydrolase [Erythrobacter litoralis]|uniref:HAD-IA family hydrolase n=1 Tax=Erythrobacter litoralis TaxID=39960 RepID=UPI0024360CC8|nr:HAD-IA family hydrolase [Erythrobacter litoralis]MDG6077995.1 HAD family hydrolase [Erythrobacter litoralis]